MSCASHFKLWQDWGSNSWRNFFSANKKHRCWKVYWGKRYIHVYNMHGFLWHGSWQYFTCTLTSVKEAVQRISIMIFYIIPWKISMGFAEHFLKFPGWRPASVVLADQLRKWIDHVIKAYLCLLLLCFHSISAFSFLPLFWALGLLIQHPLCFHWNFLSSSVGSHCFFDA